MSQASAQASGNLTSRTSEDDSGHGAGDHAGGANAPWSALFAFTAKRHIPILFCAMVVSAADGVIQPVQAIFIGRIYNNFTDFGGGMKSPTAFRHDMRNQILALAGLSTASWFFNSVFLASWIGFGELQARNARDRIFNGLLTKPIAFYDTLPFGVAALSTRSQTQIRELQLASSQPLGQTFQSLVSATASLVIAFRYSWSLTLLLLAAMPINALIINYISGRMQKHIGRQVGELAVAAKHATNAFTHIGTVKSFNGQKIELLRYLQPVRKAAAFYLSEIRGNAFQMGWLQFATLATFMGGFYYGSHVVSKGKLSTAAFITTFFSCLEVAQAVQAVLPQMIVLEKGRAAGAALRILAQVDTSTKGESVGPEMVPKYAAGTISFQKVTFAYPSRPKNLVLKNFTCSFPSREMTFIIGQSGSGKSTLPQLLLRFYEPKKGSIYVQKVNLLDLSLISVREAITLVEQQPSLFHGSIFENISIGRSNSMDLTQDDVKTATDFALLSHTLNDMPAGLDTIVGPKGSSLSGGQRQRVALARAYIRSPPILILDESTSALDSTSKMLMLAAIRRWRKGQTTICISHDIAPIEPTDFVNLMENGRLIASGYRQSLERHGDKAFARYLPSAYSGSSGDIQGSAAGRLQTSPPPPKRSASRKSTAVPYPFGRQAPTRIAAATIYDIPSRRDAALDASAPDPTNPVRPFNELRAIKARPGPATKTSRSIKRWTTKLLTKTSSATRSDVMMLESVGLDAVRHRQADLARGRPSIDSITSGSDLEDQPLTAKSKATEDEQSLVSVRETMSFNDILRTVWPSLNPRARAILVLSFVCLLVHSATVPVFCWIFSKLIQTFYLGDRATKEALKWSLSVLGLSLIDGSSTVCFHIGLEYCAQQWVDAVRAQAMAQILDQPKQYFENEEADAAKLAMILDRNAEEMRNIVGRFITFFVSVFVMLAVALIWSLAACWKLALVAFSLTPVSWVLMRLFQLVSTDLEGQSNAASESSAQVLSDVVGSIKTVRGYTLESLFTNRHSLVVTRAMRVGIKRALYCGLCSGIAESYLSFVNCIIFYYGSVLVSSRAFSVVDVILVFGQIMFAISNVSGFIHLIPQVAASKDTAIRLFALANLPQNSHEHAGKKHPPDTGNIAFEEVDFTYPTRPDDRVLNRLNLKLRRGRITAIVGGSGCGKSTLASLLLRLYDTNSSITINNKQITNLSTPALRGLIASVPQTPVLFPTTVAENITYGLSLDRPCNNATSIRNAAIAAGIHDFFATLPQGYETLIGDGGMGLSGGQAQRLAIARALVRKPQILILDEATSALDVENSAFIRGTLKRLMKERPDMCIVTVTHEREMMEMADWVVMMGKGRVLEEGTFGALMGRRGAFWGLLSGGVWSGGGDGGGEGSEAETERTEQIDLDDVDWG